MSVPRHKSERLIAAFLASKTLVEAAAKSGMSLRSVHRALKDEQFIADYRTAQQELLEGAVNRLRTSALEFANTLTAVARDMGAPAGTRAMAASRGLELLLKAALLTQLEERLSALEANASIIEKRHLR